ncbi:glycoside hydrolase family 36 protein [Spongiimicrobium sp. 2-473A-2-J]|uniref:glycoside hydrolase family 36 protein n=1 Tax=Eudoraea algarum TaxID=3417568 RepID=UPI003D368FAF
MITGTTEKNIGQISVLGAEAAITSTLTKTYDKDGLVLYDVDINSEIQMYPQPVTLKWIVPAVNVKGVWKPTADFSKRIQADWELGDMESRISIDAPVISLFGHNDHNVLTFACSNAINKLEMNARLREEDNCFHCHITFFTEYEYAMKNFKVQLRLDYRDLHFSKTLREVSQWWESYDALKPAYVPSSAKMPLYSTWYQFHQNLNEELLLKECEVASRLGYGTIIIDDGWQTVDSNRGYDYTGDWHPERIPEMTAFVNRIHQLGMKVGLWFSVPFCGRKSKAYKKFKGKFLTENHRWAPVFDPRFPEVRQYLIATYANALEHWNLDGFKLDFIDDFRLYPDTPLSQEDGRDYASINAAVDRLLTDVIKALQDINPEVFIEFRQKYTGPAMRKHGNMFRAFDCPGDATMNRVRIADIKMLCGRSAVHSDMVTWHEDEPLEIAALHMINTLFGVPQLSMLLGDMPSRYIKMIAFYTAYWKENASVLLEGDFKPYGPLSNYPIQSVMKNQHIIFGIYDERLLPFEEAYRTVHVLNAKMSEQIVLDFKSDFGGYNCCIFDCMGTIIEEKDMLFKQGLLSIAVPKGGMVQCLKQ